MGSIISLDYYKKTFSMTNILHKIARAAHIRTLLCNYVIKIFRSAQLHNQSL